MNTTLKIAVAALTLGVAAPAMAQQIDISAITCADAIAMSPEDLTLTIAFIDGYTGGEATDPVLDIERLNGDLAKVGEVCAADGTANLMETMQAALAAE